MFFHTSVIMIEPQPRPSIASFLFLVSMIPAAYPLSFNMSPITISDGGSFNLSGAAKIDSRGVQITPNASRRTIAGRATYKEPLLLWDKASRTMADFSTHFSFAIDSNGSPSYADGLAFFLAPCNYTFKNRSTGERLGLGDSTDLFVAVEFDTFINGDDPSFADVDTQCPHVGININSIISVNATLWRNDITKGFQNDAWIIYDAASTTLVVEFTGRNDSMIQRGSLSYKVDLRDYLPEYVAIGFSAATGLLFEAHNIKSWNFSSHQISQITPSKEKRTRSLVFRIGAPSLSVLIVGLSFVVFVIWKIKNKGLRAKDHFSDSSMDNEFEQGTGPRKFSYEELVLATNNFAEERKLGEGGFGGVYRGFLRATNTSITHVAVKRVSKGSKQGRREFAAEVKIISQLRHVNLVQLIGWCHQKAELLLVYEFMPNKSLDSHLFNANSLLTWEMRYKIAHGLASALLYLHEELGQYVVHRDIKASNIMLDADFNAKLGDFGLARLVPHDKISHSTIPAGTIGYMAPEYVADWRASKETDIYSFGIVLLEIACGRRPIEHSHGYPKNQIVLVEWVWNLYGAGQLLYAADPKLDTSESDVSKIERLMVVGLWCAHPDSAQRPSIRQVVQVLVSEDCLPRLPLAMPKAKYDTFGMESTSSSSGAHYDFGGASATSTSFAGSTWDLLP